MKALKLFFISLILATVIIPPLLYVIFVSRPLQLTKPYQKAHQWHFDNTGIGTFPRCAYQFPFGSGQLLISYCLDEEKTQADDNLKSISFDIPIKIEKDFLSEFFKVAGLSTNKKICFKTDTFFERNPEEKIPTKTNIFLYPSPIKDLRDVDSHKITIITVNNAVENCISSESGMTLIGIGLTTKDVINFTSTFFQGIVRNGEFISPPITKSGSKFFVGGVEMKKTEISRDSEGINYQLEAPVIPNFDFSIVNKLSVYSRTPLDQFLVFLAIAIFAWSIALNTILNNLKDGLGKIKKVLKTGPSYAINAWIFISRQALNLKKHCSNFYLERVLPFLKSIVTWFRSQITRGV